MDKEESIKAELSSLKSDNVRLRNKVKLLIQIQEDIEREVKYWKNKTEEARQERDSISKTLESMKRFYKNF